MIISKQASKQASKKASKKPLKFIAIPLLLVMICLYGWNSWNGDRDAYVLYYSWESIENWGREIGYGYINLWMNKFGFSYQNFQIIIAIITLFLLYRFFSKTAYSLGFSLLIYFIVFFSLDYVLVRSFLAFAIVLQGFLVLCRGDKYCKFKFALIVVFAASIHQSAILFLVFIFLDSIKIYSFARFLLLCIFFSLVYFVNKFFLSFLLVFDVASHLNQYGYTFRGAVVTALIHLSSVLAIWILIGLEKRNLYSLRGVSFRDREIVFIFNLNLFSLFFIPLYFQSEIFVRLLRYLLFFNIFYCVNSIVLRVKILVFVLVYFFVFSGYLIFYFLYPTMDFTVFPLFNNNILLGE